MSEMDNMFENEMTNNRENADVQQAAERSEAYGEDMRFNETGNADGTAEGSGQQETVGNSSINAGSTGTNYANADRYANGQSNGQYRNGSQYDYGSYQSGPNYYNGSSYSSGGQNNGRYGSGNGSQNNGCYGSGNGSQMRNPYVNSGQYGSTDQNAQNGGQYSGYGQYQYGSGDYGRNAGSYQEQQPQKKKEKKPVSSFWKKAAGVVVGGLCFGLIAGLSFLGVSSLGQKGETAAVQSTPIVKEQEPVAEEKSEIKSTVSNGTVTAVVTDVTEVVERTMPSIVSITNQTITSVADFWGQTYEREDSSAGSGIIIGQNDSELLIVTNNHVIDGSDKLSVKFIDDEVVEALTKGTNPAMDLAVIAVKLADIEDSTLEQISVAAMGDSDALKVGEPVIAIGNALGYGQSVTTGVVSALNRVLEMSELGTSNALIQTDAAINPGNSGGALLDINGNVIGINSNKMGGSTIEGMGYAIPISSAKPIIEDLMNRETRERVESERRGYLGISCINVNAAMAEAYSMPEGILVAQVYPASGADNAGLVKGDVIVGMNGDKITNHDALLAAMEYFAVGDTVNMTIMRGNITDGYEEMVVPVTLTSQDVMEAVEQ